MNVFLLVTMTLVALVTGTRSAPSTSSGVDVTPTIAAMPETSTTADGPKYFGVDANDDEAVRQKQRELGEENWNKLFPGLDINSINFEPDMDLTPESIKVKVDEVRHKLHDMVDKAVDKVVDVVFSQHIPGLP